MQGIRMQPIVTDAFLGQSLCPLKTLQSPETIKMLFEYGFRWAQGTTQPPMGKGTFGGHTWTQPDVSVVNMLDILCTNLLLLLLLLLLKLPYLTAMVLWMGELWRTGWSKWQKCRYSIAAWLRVWQHHVWHYITTTHWCTDQHWPVHFQCFKQYCKKTISLFARLTQLGIFALSPACIHTHVQTSQTNNSKTHITKNVNYNLQCS